MMGRVVIERFDGEHGHLVGYVGGDEEDLMAVELDGATYLINDAEASELLARWRDGIREPCNAMAYHLVEIDPDCNEAAAEEVTDYELVMRIARKSFEDTLD